MHSGVVICAWLVLFGVSVCSDGGNSEQQRLLAVEQATEQLSSDCKFEGTLSPAIYTILCSVETKRWAISPKAPALFSP